MQQDVINEITESKIGNTNYSHIKDKNNKLLCSPSDTANMILEHFSTIGDKLAKRLLKIKNILQILIWIT